MMRKSFIWAVGVMLCALFAISSCGTAKNAETSKEEKAKPVAVTEVCRRDIAVASEFSAVIKPKMEVQVVPEIAGKVAEVHVAVGQRVKKGQVLVTLESEEIRAQVHQAEAALEKAKAALTGTRSQILQAETNYKNAKANFENAEKEYQRMRFLYEQGVVSEQQFNSVEMQYRVAESNFQAAEQQLEITKKTAYELAVSDVRQAEANLSLARTRLENTVIKSPIDGIVSVRNIDPGEMASPGVPVVTVVDMDVVVARAGITERDVNRLKEGQQVSVIVGAAPGGPFKGKISSLSPAADSQSGNTYELEVDITNGDHIIKPGMSATIVAVVEEVNDVLSVPIGSVVERGGRTVAFVVKNEKAVIRRVITGLKDDHFIEIKSGLSEGDKVVAAGQHILNDGDRVVIQNGGNKK